MKPPDSLLTQIGVYTEEKVEDEEDMRDRMQSLMKREAGQKPLSDSETLLQELATATEDDAQLHTLLMDVMRQVKVLLLRDLDEWVLCAREGGDLS
jgi:diaphanous 1